MGVVELNIRIRDLEKPWLFHVLADLEYPCILRLDFIGGSKIILDFDRKSLGIQDSQVKDIKVDEGNLRIDLSETKLNVVANVLDNNTIESIIGEKVNCAIIRDFVLSSRDQLIEEQKTDPELGHIYRYLENQEDSSVNVAICENWSRDFRLVEGLLFYAKYATSLGEMRVYISKSLRNEIMREFHDKPLAGHFGRFKTYHKTRDVCYFPYMRKYIDQYVSTCHMFQINNYKNALPAGRLIPIVSNYPNEIVKLDLLGPYPMSRVRRNRYVLIITDHFSNERLGIRHVKTVVYRPHGDKIKRVNCDLVQMIANYVNEQHGTWDQFLREFAYAIRTAVNKTTGKTHAELFLGRKLITPFQKLVMVSDGTEFALGDIERLFKEARRNTKTKHEKWEKYYNKRRRDVQIKVRMYRHRKCDETEIGTGSSDNGSLRDESGSFDRVQRRSNDSGDSKKKGSEVGRTRKESSEHRVPKRNLSSNDTNNVLPKNRKKSRREETVAPTTSGYNLRPRIGKREEIRPTIERKTQQGGPVRSRKVRERNDSPYIEERTRSSNKNARRGGDQQRQDQ
ncbi:retrovirus-related Pol polyprotein from transposon 297 [Trichonephila clavipes]|nr:retrovirus-related Pol polyprotein from transposon 297 [Trichonephila clavipes]